jgi:hypothetical protein
MREISATQQNIPADQNQEHQQCGNLERRILLEVDHRTQEKLLPFERTENRNVIQINK